MANDLSLLWTLRREPTTDWQHFVNSWSHVYQYNDVAEYRRIVQQLHLNEADIRWLMRWKNGMKLSESKQDSVDSKIVAKHTTITQLRQHFSLVEFDLHFTDVSAIWRVFLLHIIQPESYPIFDQHVYRAYGYLTTGEGLELPLSDAKRMNLYHTKYLPFFNQIAVATTTGRQTIDQALWAFGKFIKQYPTFSKHD